MWTQAGEHGDRTGAVTVLMAVLGSIFDESDAIGVPA